MQRSLNLLAMSVLAAFGSAALVPTAFASNAVTPENKDGNFRAPHLVGEQLVFTAEGDLWLTTLAQSTPQRLTSTEAEEHQAALSPDGQYVAFVANYEGAPEAYVMPLTGGTPKRVSFEQSRVRIQGWTPSGELMYATDHVMGPANQWVLRTVNPSTLAVTTLPLIDAIEGSMNSNGDTLFFTRFGLQTTGDNARVYRGGAMGDIWRFTLGESEEAINLTAHHSGSVRKPMYYNGRVYFLSDADGTPNLWSVAATGANNEADYTQHTRYNDWQI